MKNCHRYAARALCSVAGMLFAASAFAADADVTGLVPTIWWDFETKPGASGLPGANKGSASISFTSEGTATYQAGFTNGWAVDTSKFTPYSGAGSFSTKGNPFTLSLVMTLGTKENGITLNLRTTAGDLIIRRGAEAGSLVIGLGPQKAASTKFLNATFADGDTAFHLVSIVAEQSGTSLYVDGNLVTNTTEFTLWSESGCASQMQFGSHLDGTKTGEAKYGGCIDDLRIHDAALTPVQMEAIAVEYGIVVPEGHIAVRASGEPTVGKNTFSTDWSLAIAPDDSAEAGLVYGTDAALSAPTTNALGTALSAGDYTASLAGLNPGTTYWWKIVASNGVNWAETPIASFRTLDEVNPTTFVKRIPITVSGYTGESTLTNFPVLVTLADNAPSGFNYADCATDGADIRFAAADGTILSHEIDTWNANGESFVWVGIPALTNGTTFTMYYGSDAPGATASANLWSLAGYAGVWHLTDGHDSTANGLDGTIVSGISGATDSKLGGALDFANTRMSVGTTPNSVLANGFSIEAWCYPRNRSTKAIFGKNTAMSVRIEDSSIRVTTPSVLDHDPANCSIAANEWFHLGLTFLPNPSTDGTGTIANQYKVYRDGVQKASLGASRIPNLTSNDEMWIGGNKWSEQSFNGICDEFRLSYFIRSADWIKAVYDTTASPTIFAERGAVEQANPDAPRIDVTAATVSHSDATFSVTLSNVSSETVVSVFFGPDFSTLTELTLGTLSADGTLTGTATGLGAATYVWYARATTTVAGVAYAIKSGRKDFTVTYAKEPSSSYKHFTATISYAGTAIAGVPVPIRISETAIEGFHYADVTETGFEFVDADGNILPWELDTWDTEGESVVWVKVPSYCEGAAITARYGATFANLRPAASDVWSAYTGVWHLGDLDASASTYGSYPNSTAVSGIDGEKAEASVADEKGVLGKSVMISQSTSKQGEGYQLGGVFVPDAGAGSPLDLGDTFAISGWFKHKDFDYYWDKIFGKRKKASNQESPNGAFAIEIGNNGSGHNVTACGAASTSTKLNFKTSLKNSWSHIAFVYEGKSCRVYQNGSLIGTSAIVEVTNNNAPLCFGNLTGGYGNGTGDAAWAGWIDEVRLADGVLSAEYLAAEYDAVTNIVAFGSVVSVEMGDPRISAPVIERQQDGSFLVMAEISENEPMSGSVKCVVGGMEFAMTTSDASLPATYSAVVTGLPDGTYRATVRAQAEGGSVVARESTAVFYAGALVVTKVVDAEEATLSPGTFRISRADVDPTELPAISFDVVFSGPGLSAIVEPTITSLTIPAGAASVDISVTPIYTTEVDADVALTLSVSGAFVGTPSSGSITIVNSPYDPSVRYVATTGDDANHGGTPASPKKTIGAAVESLAPVFPSSATIRIRRAFLCRTPSMPAITIKAYASSGSTMQARLSRT